MAEIFCVVLSVVVHFIFRLAVFVDFTSDDSNLMHLPSLMVLLSVCMMLVDNQVFPARYVQEKEVDGSVSHDGDNHLLVHRRSSDADGLVQNGNLD